MSPRFLLPLVLLLLLAPIASAELQYYTDRPNIAPSNSGGTFVDNTQGGDAFDVVVEITPGPGLRLRTLSAVGVDWECAFTAASGTCRIGRFEAGRFDGVFFEVDATDREGGHRPVTATLTARNVRTQTILFDVLTSHSAAVTSSADSGPGSLRAAIEEANAHPLCGTDVPCIISLADNLYIAPLTPLPPIRKCNVGLYASDGWEIAHPVKKVSLSGENVTSGNGIEIRAACANDVQGVAIHGLAIHSWPENGVYISSPAAHGANHFGHSITRCHIGTDATGLIARPNGRGVVSDSPHDVVSVGDSVVSGNLRSGLAFYGGRRASVGAKIGVDRAGNPMGNGASGIFTWGTPLFVASSTIAHNAHYGVAIARGTPGAVAIFNEIHSNGGLPVDWGLDDRTPPDDETDGILNAPRITDAFYSVNENRTVIRGTVRLRAGADGERYRIEAYEALSARGDVSGRIGLPEIVVTPPADGSAADIPFEISLFGDNRGKLVAVQTVARRGFADVNSSEISEGVAVR
jgi:hypothetical protein